MYFIDQTMDNTMVLIHEKIPIQTANISEQTRPSKLNITIMFTSPQTQVVGRLETNLSLQCNWLGDSNALKSCVIFHC